VRPDKSSSAHWWKSSSGKGQAATRSEQATDAVGWLIAEFEQGNCIAQVSFHPGGYTAVELDQ